MSFLAKKLKDRSEFILRNSTVDEQKDLLEDLIATGSAMADAGVESEQDFKDFFYVSAHVGNIVKEIVGSDIDDESLAKVSHLVFTNREQFPINTIMNFYHAVKNALDSFELPITKKAYPQGFENTFVPAPHNLTRWVESLRQIYAYKQRGFGSSKAFDLVTQKWDEMEKKDFNHWMKFYQSSGHLDYKTAQLRQRYYAPGEDASQIPFSALQNIDALRASLPQRELMNAEDAKLHQFDERKKQEKEDIADKMTKLVGRLNSAEKIFTSADFKKVLGNEYDEWLECLHKLKRIIYSKQTKSASIISDLMVLQGNKLRANGFRKAGRLMDILAVWQYQVRNQFDDAIGIPFFKQAQTPPPPLGGGDMGGGLAGESSDIMGGSGAGVGPDDGRDLSDPEGAMREFVENLGGEEGDKPIKAADFDEDGAMIIVAEDGFYRFAQEAPMPPAPETPAPAPTPTPEAAPKALAPEEKMTADKKNADRGDNAIDAALKNIRLPDVIAKLEELVQFYRNRQFSRELLVVDLMLEALGISAFFPSMAEAAKSSLDSNQYVLTRMEDMLSKLRGAAAAEDGTMNNIKEKLQQQVDNKDKKREEKEKSEMVPATEAPPEGAPVPAQELAQPAAVEQVPQPAPVR